MCPWVGLSFPTSVVNKCGFIRLQNTCRYYTFSGKFIPIMLNTNALIYIGQEGADFVFNIDWNEVSVKSKITTDVL